MTDTPVTPAATPSPAAAPAPDTNAIVERAASAAAEAAMKMVDSKASEIATKKLQEIGRAMANEPKPDPTKQFLEGFVSDPAKAFHAVKEITKRELREENQAAENIRATQRNVIGPIINEYPELNNPTRLKFVEKLADDYKQAGMSYDAALEKAGKETVKELGLKSVSEAQRSGSYGYAGLPGGGGFNPGAPRHDEQKSQSSFLQSMRERAAAVRLKRPLTVAK